MEITLHLTYWSIGLGWSAEPMCISVFFNLGPLEIVLWFDRAWERSE